MDLDQATTFEYQCKSVARLEGNQFDDYNWIFYTLLCVAVADCGLRYCDKHKTKNNGQVACRDLVHFYYGSINDEKEILNIERKIKRDSYFREEEELNYEEYIGKLCTMF